MDRTGRAGVVGTGWLAAVVAAMILAAACGRETTERTALTTPAATGTARDPGWRPIAAAPEGVGFGASQIWTGSELIVRGTNDGKTFFAAAYDLAFDRWRELAPPPDEARYAWTGVWTGNEVLYWGDSVVTDDRKNNQAFAYDPAADRWQVRAAAPVAARSGAEAAWVGDEMIVWGGIDRCCPIDSTVHLADAAAYDPARDTWRALTRVPQPWSGDGGPAMSLVHDGKMLVYRADTLGEFDPAANQWKELGEPSLPQAGCMSTNGPSSHGFLRGDRLLAWTGGCGAELGVAFDLARSVWTRVADAPAPILSVSFADPDVLATAAPSGEQEAVKVLRYDMDDDRWSVVEPPPVGFRRHALTVWTGNELLLWGPGGEDHPPSGAAYTPPP